MAIPNRPTFTSEQYKAAARINLWAAKMRRLQDDKRASEVHIDLADIYIKQELRRGRQ